MKKIIVLSFVFVTMIFMTGCESKDLTTYVKEKKLATNRTIGYIEMDKDKFKELATQKEFKKLMKYVKKKKYEYFMVAFENKKGLFCISPNCIYESIDKNADGVYVSGTKFYGKIEQNDDDVYKYHKYSNEEK